MRINPKRPLMALLAAALLFIPSCSSEEKLEEKFVDSIEALEPTGNTSLEGVASMHELIEGSRANFIMFGTVTERGECEAVADGAIITPYAIHVNEIYLGDINKEGDSIRLDARYGVIGDSSYREADYPILEVGKSYVFFLRYDIVGGSLAPRLATNALGAVEADAATDALTLNVSDSFIDSYNGSATAMVSDIVALVETNEYDTSIGVVE